MSKNIRFADDGWAFWVAGNDTSTIYLHEWVNPTGKSCIDIGIRVRQIRETKELKLYIPFQVEHDELEDISFQLEDPMLFRATFDATGLYEPMKNKYTSEIVFKGDVMDLVHISLFGYEIQSCDEGTMLSLSISRLQEYLDNDTAYFYFRLPQKSLMKMCEKTDDAKILLKRMRDLISSPRQQEKYGHAVRINEARRLPDTITKQGEFHRQKLDKAILSVSIHEDYRVNEANCYRIQRMEENLYKDFAPDGYDCGSAITYIWRETREDNKRGQFSFYINLSNEVVSTSSMAIYMILLLIFGAGGNALWTLISYLLGLG